MTNPRAFSGLTLKRVLDATDRLFERAVTWLYEYGRRRRGETTP